MSTAHRLALAAVVTVVISMGVSLAGAGPALAHTKLVAADPAQDATVTSFEAVRLRFTEPLRPEFSALAVTATNGAPVVSGSAAVTGTEITVPVTVTDGGSYTVAYRVLSADGHPVEGSYAVTFAPAPPSAASASPSAAEPSAAEPSNVATSGTAADGARAGGGTVLVGFGAGLLGCAALAGAGLVWRRRMREHA